MSKTIADIAADPLQYDLDELIWTDEGSKDNFNRRLYLEALYPLLITLSGKSIVDVGCGQGWLCDEIARRGGHPLGIEPSAKNVQAAHEAYPGLNIVQVSLQSFKTNKQFDVLTAIMVLEHFIDIDKAFKEIADLLKPVGRFITIVGDFDKFTNEQGHHPLEKEIMGPGEIATRVNYGERAGIMCDIIRTIERYIQAADLAELTLRSRTPILPSPWHPRYKTHQGRPLFHLLEFAKDQDAFPNSTRAKPVA